MARTTAEIQQEIETYKEAQPSLDVLSSPSSVSIWQQIKVVVAAAIFTLETLFDKHKADVNSLISAEYVQTAPWWISKSLAFQYGDDLIGQETGQPQYAVLLPATDPKRIVKFASVNGATVSAAKDNGSGLPIQLTPDELTAFDTYIDDLAIPGTNMIVQSLATDYLKLIGTIYYDGLYVETDLMTAVELAINTYLQSIDFGGVLRNIKLIDAIQSVPGVIDVVFTDIEAKSNAGSYAAVARIYQTVAGYIEIDPAFPLSTNLTYTVS